MHQIRSRLHHSVQDSRNGGQRAANPPNRHAPQYFYTPAAMGLFADWGIYREASPRREVERRQDVFHCPCPPGPSTRDYGRVHNQPCFCYIPRTDLVLSSRIISLFSWGQSLALSPLFRSFFLTRQIYAWFSGTGRPHSQMDDPVTTVQPSRPLAAFLGSLLGRLHLVCVYTRECSPPSPSLSPPNSRHHSVLLLSAFLPPYPSALISSSHFSTHKPCTIDERVSSRMVGVHCLGS